MDETPPSRPLTPNEQIDIMTAIEREDDLETGLPSDRDLEVCYSNVEAENHNTNVVYSIITFW